jgi:hypothetical protein
MGLDMYVYAVDKAAAVNDFSFDNSIDPKIVKQWRKHPNLHGWMEKLWRKKLEQTGAKPTVFKEANIGFVVTCAKTNKSFQVTFEDLKAGKLPKGLDMLPKDALELVKRVEEATKVRAADSDSNFNCVPLRLTVEDLAKLALDIAADALPATTGFFFGESERSAAERADDLSFVVSAVEHLKNGSELYYNSSW